jgi:gliding motility-associated-like protein
MKYILFVFIYLSSLNINSQTIIREYEICDEYLNKEIRAVTNSNSIIWDVNPEIPYQVNSNTMYITFNNIGTYVITAEFSNGLCYAEDKLIIRIIECNETFIYFPNVFTPDDDRNNDNFGAYGVNVLDFTMLVFNRWGEIIFRAEDINDRWNGFYKGRLCQNDVYVYKVTYKNTKGKQFTKIGRVALIN